jgi:hypothetical protein
MPKVPWAYRFSPQLYEGLKELASENGYTFKDELCESLDEILSKVVSGFHFGNPLDFP